MALYSTITTIFDYYDYEHPTPCYISACVPRAKLVIFQNINRVVLWAQIVGETALQTLNRVDRHLQVSERQPV